MREGLLVRSSATSSYFVEVAANEPHARPPTWLLEQSDWTGVLVEPQPDLAIELRAKRKARVFDVACSSPENAGRNLSFHVAGPLSSLDRHHMAPGAMPERVISVPVRMLDSISTEAGAPIGFDFLSIDVEGHEIEVLRGFDIARWKPHLNVLEDHVGNLSKHRYLLGAGYRIIRRGATVGTYAGIRGQMPVDRSLGDPAQILPGPAISGFAQSFAQTAHASQVLISSRSGTLAGGFQSCVCS
jgi:FkbM family methyltransferase